jgi:Fic family protein
VTGADDDHCEPGALRRQDQNVSFGQPGHRGVDGGPECENAFDGFIVAIQREYPDHDPIIQALAAHYHLAAMHPFLDGNGRTARALAALFLQRAGLRDTCFIAMSNYYYDEKPTYLTSLAESRARDHDITPFVRLGLKGIAVQSRRLLDEIRIQVQKALFKNMMYDLFGRLKTPRKRVIAKRQIQILSVLLKEHSMDVVSLYDRVKIHYTGLANPGKAFFRDLSALVNLKTVDFDKLPNDNWKFTIRLEWPMEITETDFMQRVKSLPKAKTFPFK